MRIKLMLALLSFVFANTTAQIKELFVNCDPADLQFIYDNYEQDIYIPAFFEYDGATWSNVSIRIRSDRSRQFPKKSLKVRFNEGAYSDGRTNLNINAEWEDQSYIQQSIASRLMRESGQACFTATGIRESEELLTLTLYPNPVNVNSYDLTIGSQRNANATLEILDLTGRLVYQQDLALRARSNAKTIHHGIESQGIYLRVLKTTGMNYAKRFVLTDKKH